MLFNSALYGVFLLAVYAAFWALRTHRIPRAVMLTLASYFFYFYGTYDTSKEQDVPLGPLGWSVLCLGVIFVGSTIDFAVGKKLGATEDPRMRKALLLVSVVYYLGVLSIFKYFNFAADSVATVLGWMHVKIAPTHLRLVLPFGISFFTFETMSYTIDVYRGEFKPAQKYLDYLLFVAFFPHLVAGPIVRPHTMLPQFEREPVAAGMLAVGVPAYRLPRELIAQEVAVIEIHHQSLAIARRNWREIKHVVIARRAPVASKNGEAGGAGAERFAACR